MAFRFLTVKKGIGTVKNKAARLKLHRKLVFEQINITLVIQQSISKPKDNFNNKQNKPESTFKRPVHKI